MTGRQVVRNNKEKNPVCCIIFIRVCCKDIYQKMSISIYTKGIRCGQSVLATMVWQACWSGMVKDYENN